MPRGADKLGNVTSSDHMPVTPPGETLSILKRDKKIKNRKKIKKKKKKKNKKKKKQTNNQKKVDVHMENFSI